MIPEAGGPHVATTCAVAFAASLVAPSEQCETWCRTGGEAPTLAGLLDDDPRQVSRDFVTSVLPVLKKKKNESVNGRNRFRMKVFLDENVFAIWMKVYLTGGRHSVGLVVFSTMCPRGLWTNWCCKLVRL